MMIQKLIKILEINNSKSCENKCVLFAVKIEVKDVDQSDLPFCIESYSIFIAFYLIDIYQMSFTNFFFFPIQNHR